MVVLCECSICIVSSRLLLGRTFKCILALGPEMSENSRVSWAFSSFTHMCRGAFWVAVFMTRPFLGECISLWDALKVRKVICRCNMKRSLCMHVGNGSIFHNFKIFSFAVRCNQRLFVFLCPVTLSQH